METFFDSLLTVEKLFFYAPLESASAGLTIVVGRNFENYPSLKRKINKWSIESQESVQMLKKENGTPAYPLASPNSENSLNFRSLNSDITRKITREHYVNKLTFVSFCSGTDFMYLSEMLTQEHLWSQELTSLKLINCFEAKWLSCAPALFSAINRLRSLKTLWLDLGNAHMYELPILAQLKEVRLQCLDSEFSVFIDSLEKYVPEGNPNGLQVDLPNGQYHFLELEKRGTAVRRFFSRLSNWQLYTSSMDVGAFCTNYPLLRSVTFAFPSAEIERVFSAFKSLEHLLHLRLTINFGDRAMHGSYRLASPFLSPSNDDADDFSDPAPLNNPAYQLKTVKALDLKVIFPTHAEVQWLNLSVTMPSLQSLSFAKYTCRECKHFGMYSYRKPVLKCEPQISIQCFGRFLDDLHPSVPLYYTMGDVLVPARELLDKNGDVDKVEVVKIEVPRDYALWPPKNNLVST